MLTYWLYMLYPYVVIKHVHIVPTIFHGHEVFIVDVHTKIHRTRFAVQRFHFVVDLLTVVEQICPLFGWQSEVQTQIALRHHSCLSSKDGEHPTSIDNEVPIVADNELSPPLEEIIIIIIIIVTIKVTPIHCRDLPCHLLYKRTSLPSHW